MTDAERVAALEAQWPDWELWLVHQVIGGTAWCARRRDDHKWVLNAGSAGELAEYLEEAAGEPGGDSPGSTP